MHLYLHIPFCRKACHYCDFHFSTNLSQKELLVKAMVAELERQKDYLADKHLSTIYFGGGTPSLLSEEELDTLMNAISARFSVSGSAEITLEANPDDLSPAALSNFSRTGINRLSIGIQTFDDEMLGYLNRTHTGEGAMEAVKRAQDSGIGNISLDLIYALPAPDHERLKSDIGKIISLDAAHLSAYCLTIEPDTAFGRWVQSRKMLPVDEEFAAAQFEITTTELSAAGYEQYEISNFARDGHYSRHNTAYWQRKPYLGIGPGAHSYNGSSRQFNVSNNNKYIKDLTSGISPATVEILTSDDQVNEYLLTGLRTKWGCSLDMLDQLSEGVFRETHRSTVKELVARGWLQMIENTLLLTPSGKLFADRVASDLFIG
ncbi:MAG: coproporphyrinogen III oxidase [Cytophagaceae bacterium SCN 52-12]|nr:MAG: coproporphyrinogen III oxidase [Cytophagaceae bacterium SCN 52-12]